MRFVAFAVVGAGGFVVQIATLAIVTRAGVGPFTATVIAVEAAVLHNFAWHERWTWSDRCRRRGAAHTWRRLADFHLANGATSIGAAIVAVATLTRGLGWPPVFANVAGIATTGIVNYIALDRWVFGARAE